MSTAGSIRLGVRQLQAFRTGASNVASVAIPIGLQLTELVKTGKATVASLRTAKGPFDAAVQKSKACSRVSGSNG